MAFGTSNIGYRIKFETKAIETQGKEPAVRALFNTGYLCNRNLVLQGLVVRNAHNGTLSDLGYQGGHAAGREVRQVRHRLLCLGGRHDALHLIGAAEPELSDAVERRCTAIRRAGHLGKLGALHPRILAVMGRWVSP
jgi:hypothetical protein